MLNVEFVAPEFVTVPPDVAPPATLESSPVIVALLPPKLSVLPLDVLMVTVVSGRAEADCRTIVPALIIVGPV